MSDELARELDHVLRSPLPWRRITLTECGLSPQRCKTITHQDLAAKLRKLGQQRTAFSTCMTCLNKVTFHRSTGEPATSTLTDLVRREVHNYGRDDVMETELRAIATLIERHREEYDAILDGLTEAPSLAEHRQRRRGRG